jgi:hypothetical protein
MYLESSYVIHEDNFTETMDGITTLLTLLKREGNLTEAPICRAIILMSHFMIENVFWTTVKHVLNEQNIDQEIKEQIAEDYSQKIGISEAIEKWPFLLTGQNFDFSREPFASLVCLINERNDVTHSERVSYYSSYIDTFDGAASAYYTALECTKKIQKYLLGQPSIKYSEFEQVFSPPKKVLFQHALNYAKSNSIKYLSPQDYPENLKSLNEYKNSTISNIENEIEEYFGQALQDATEICQYSINATDYFIEAITNISEENKKEIAKKIAPLFRTLTLKKMIGKYGIRFGEVLPHVRLKIRRLRFGDHHGYMCMPTTEHLVVFLIGTADIILTDIINKA